jgi:hypothetical protein
MEGSMAATYRFSLLRADGWARLGFAGAIAVLFGTPMMWALGVFGHDEGAVMHAVVFLFGGLFMALGLGYAVGWAVRGFTIRLKDSDDEEGGGRRPGPAAGPPHPPTQAPRPPPR